LTYDQVHEAVYLKEQAARREQKSFLPLLEKAKTLAALLSEQRRRRGALGFILPEAEIVLEEGEIHAIHRLQRNQAHILVEECMLAANEAVAQTLDQATWPVLFRVHEEPDSEKVEDFKETAKILGLPLPQGSINPAWFAQALARSQGSPLEYVVNNLLLRTMQRARYTPENLGHFGLAAHYYLHFTSPIRRYPDLVAHRALQALLTQNSQPDLLPKGIDLETAGSFLSGRERAAIEVERNVQARLSSLFLRQRVGEIFAAVISGVTSFGLFVELLDCLVSGAIPVREMADDFYHYDTTQHRLLGERRGKRYGLGDTVQVRLERVDMLSKKLTFSLVDKI
jgi:ribonuclease R